MGAKMRTEGTKDSQVPESGFEFINIPEDIPEGSKNKAKINRIRMTRMEDSKYICAICQKSYSRPSRLRRHFRKHTGELRTKWFNCNSCCKQFSTETKLEKHNLRRHEENHQEVSVGVNIKIEPEDHPLEEPEIKSKAASFKCTICRLSYSAQKFLDKHMFYHTEKQKPFPCKSCDEQFDKTSELRLHREKIHAQECCGGCGEMVTSLQDRQRHRTMHSESKYKYECNFCQKRLCRLKSLEYHIRKTHMGDKFKCELCLKGFPRVGLLMAHSIAKHGNDRPFSCKVCGFKVNRMSSLRSHMITHTKEKKFHCETCGKAFGHSSTFYKHARMHEKAKLPKDKRETTKMLKEERERLFQCEICAKAFFRMADLKLHLRFHSDVRPYKCTVCPKAFHSSSIMKNHIDRHFGIRRHVCQHCGQAYTDPTGLRRHLVKHGDSSIKTFNCDHCGKIFVQRYQLVRHTATHMLGTQALRRGGLIPEGKERSFSCEICPMTYARQAGLQKHMLKHEVGSEQQNKDPDSSANSNGT
ncbi:hypothetical protein DMENIID0001_050960 [Sergentomyia squamirostris]